MKNCLIALAVSIALLFVAGFFLYMGKDTIVTAMKGALNMPPYGKEEFIKPRFQSLFDKLDKAATEADSVFTFGAAIENMDLPEETFYIGIEKGDATTDVIKKTEWGSHHSRTLNRFGAGTFDVDEKKIEVMIYKSDDNWDYMDNYVVYLEFKEEAMTPALEPATNLQPEP